MEYAPHQQRVVDELNELQDKLTKLGAFVASASFDQIVKDTEEQARLVKQKFIMQDYADVLQLRINNFN